MDSRKRKRLLLVFAGVALLSVLSFWFLNQNTEPTYDGRPLSEWIGDYSDPLVGTSPRAKAAEAILKAKAAEAIRAIGTNGLPCLLNWISYEPGPWRDPIGSLAERLPDSITGGSPLYRLTFPAGVRRAAHAATAFRVLGPMAAPAIPELARLLAITNSTSSSQRALCALFCLGPAAVPAIANILSSPRYAGDRWAMDCIENMGTNARAITPIIVSNLTHTNDLIAEMTAWSFIMVGPTNHFDADLLVPALIQCLQDPRPNVRKLAVFPLRTLGAAAAPAWPALTNALQDPDPQVRTNAAKAIQYINKHLQN